MQLSSSAVSRPGAEAPEGGTEACGLAALPSVSVRLWPQQCFRRSYLGPKAPFALQEPPLTLPLFGMVETHQALWGCHDRARRVTPPHLCSECTAAGNQALAAGPRGGVGAQRAQGCPQVPEPRSRPGGCQQGRQGSGWIEPLPPAILRQAHPTASRESSMET